MVCAVRHRFFQAAEGMLTMLITGGFGLRDFGAEV